MTAVTKLTVGSLDILVRPLISDELEDALALISAQGCLMTLSDIKIMYQADPQALIGVFLQDGTLIGYICVAKCGSTLRYSSIIIIEANYRRRGIARIVLQYIVDTSKGTTVTVDSLPHLQALYEQFGFAVTGYKLGVSGNVCHDDVHHTADQEYRLCPVTSQNIDGIIKYDSLYIAIDREVFMKLWILSDESKSFCCTNMLGNIVGFIIVRETRNGGFRVYGLYANDCTVASKLLSHATSHLPNGAAVSSWVPEGNSDATMAVMKKSLKDVDVNKDMAGIIMARGNGYPKVDWAKVYCVANVHNTYI